MQRPLHDLSGLRHGVLCAAALFVGCMLAGDEFGVTQMQRAAADGGVLAKSESFSSILDMQTRVTYQRIAKYVADNPQANDVENAYRWLLAAALEYHFEAEAVSIAEGYAARKDADPSVRQVAQQVQCLGFAKTGEMKQAMGIFQDQLRSARFRNASGTVDFARRLAAETALANDFGATREVYEQLSSTFFLNSNVKQMCETKLAKLELIDKAAPAIGVEDTAGKSVDLDGYAGKVVLVDFWATNCRPCLEEFPNMKQIYADYHDKGFEVVGISLDQVPETVDEFQKQWKLPWRMVVNESKVRQLREKYRVVTIPSMYLVDKQGRIVQFDLKGHNLRVAVQRLLEAKP